jgi:hypothetical protein
MLRARMSLAYQKIHRQQREGRTIMGEAKRRDALRDAARKQFNSGGDEMLFDYLMAVKLPKDFDPNPPPSFIENFRNLDPKDRELLDEMQFRLMAIAARRGGTH